MTLTGQTCKAELRTARLRQRHLLKRLQYFLMGHAVALNNQERIAFRNGPKVFANSIPKAGTNLIKKLFDSLSCMAPRWGYHLDRQIDGYLAQLAKAKRGQLVTSHMPWSEDLIKVLQRERFKMFFMVRDIRDLAYSNVYYYTCKDKSHPLNRHFVRLSDDGSRLLASIQGVSAGDADDGQEWGTIGARVENYLGWLDEPCCLTIRFEDLVGKAGGGSDERQFETVKAILRHLDLDYSDSGIRQICRRIYTTKSRTFRKGQIGDWTNHFNHEHKEVFKRVAGQTLIRLGYERNLNW